MTRPPLLSIITVVKDDAAGLAATGTSITAQAWTDFEWLVADGGSGPEIAAAFLKTGLQPHWFDSRADGGPFAGMDRAMARARGDYLLFLNAGDTLADAHVLCDLAPLLAAGRLDLFYGDTGEDPGDGRRRRKRARHWRWAFYGMPAHHCAIFYRRTLLAGLHLDCGYRIAGDYAITLQVLQRAQYVARLPRLIAVFAPGGLSRQHAALGRREQDHIRQQLLGLSRAARATISLLQIVAATLRSLSPKGYALWRF